MQGVEYKLFERDLGVCIFQIPNLSTSKGYFLDDWKQMIWEGGIKVIDLNNQQVIIFQTTGNKQEFARFTVPKNYVEAIQKTQDSARGYAMRLQSPNGGFMWFGIAFRDRNDAFDFNLIVSEFQEKKERELNPNKFQNEIKVQDFTLKEKIVLTSQGVKTVQNTQPKQQASLSSFKFGDGPEQSQPQQQKPQQNFQQQPQTNNNNNFSDFSDFGNPQQPQKTNQSDFSDFSDFGNFNNNTNNFNQQQQQQNFQQNNNNVNSNQQGQQQNQQCENLLDL